MSQLRVRLKDVAKRIQYGYTASASDDEGIGPKFLRITDIVPDQIDWLNVPFCPIEENLFDKYALHSGDIVIARTGNTTGYAKLIREEQRAVFASYLIRVQLDERKADPGFVGRLVESNAYKQFVNSQKGGAAQGNANAQVLTLFEFILPPLQIQHKIASILSAYDDLIENNRRRMVLLEESARLLYREWFVHLHFPGHARTRVTAGVPKGWERKTLGDIADVNSSTLPSGFDGEIEYVDIASVTPGQINETTTYDFRDAPSRARRVVQHGDIIWSCVRPNRRSHAVIWDPPTNLIASTGFAVITPKDVPATFLYCVTTTDAFVGYLENHARGAAYPAVVAKDFERAEIVVPSKRLLDDYNDLIEPSFAQTHTLRQQNQKLRTARDLLLPRLMSGELPV